MADSWTIAYVFAAAGILVTAILIIIIAVGWGRYSRDMDEIRKLGGEIWVKWERLNRGKP